MKKLSPKLSLAIFVSLSLCLISCEKEDPLPEVDQEVITEVTLLFSEVNDSGEIVSGSGFEVVARDAEGISLGNSPEIDAIEGLKPGKKYLLEVSLYNSIVGEDVTVEVAEDDTEHQFYFLGSTLVGETAFLSYEYNDEDINAQPVGLKGHLTVGSPAITTGTFRVVLRHDLNKAFEGANDPSFENFEQAGGETDLDVTFQVIVNE
jgi:hypothetical protein